MSFDMFVHRFYSGDARSLSRETFDAVLGPYIYCAKPQHGYCRLRTPDGGEADVYAGLDGNSIDAVMINHFSAGEILELVALFAQQADAVIIPVGCPTLLTNAGQIDHLPDELKVDSVVISSGVDISSTIAAS